MYIKDLAKIIYTPNTTSENTQVTVFTGTGEQKCKKLWEGRAIGLQNAEFIKKDAGWQVCEILRNNSKCFSNIPKYNRPYIIYVV